MADEPVVGIRREQDDEDALPTNHEGASPVSESHSWMTTQGVVAIRDGNLPKLGSVWFNF